MKKKWIAMLSALLMVLYTAGAQTASYQVLSGKETVCCGGVLPVYQQEGKVFLEISPAMQGREWYISAQIDKGFDLIDRPAKSVGVVRVQLSDDKKEVLLEQPFYSERICDPDSELIPAFGASNYQRHGMRLPVAEVLPDGRALVDVTDLLATGNDWFEYMYASIRGLDGSKSKIRVVRALADGVHFTIQRQHGYESERAMLSSSAMILPASSIPLQVSCVIRVLPKQDMAIRLAEPESSYQVVSFTDYGQDPYTTIKDSLVIRWRMEPAEAERARSRKGKLVYPKQPLVFAIDGYFPEVYVKAVEEAVAGWNKALEQAGFRDALLTRRMKREEPTAGERALIAYDMGPTGVKGTLAHHPRTGEILQCRINIGHGFLPERCVAWEWLTGEQAKDVELLRVEVAKVVGEMLGLRSRKSLPLLASSDYKPDRYALYALSEGYRPFLQAASPLEERDLLHRYLQTTFGSKVPGMVDKEVAVLSAYASSLEKMKQRFASLDQYKKGNVREFYRKGLKCYGECIVALSDWIGSDRPADEQRKAMHLLSEYVFRGSEAFSNRYAEAGGMEDRRFHIGEPVKEVFEKLLSPDTQTALVRAGWYAWGDKSFTADVFFADLYASLFQDFRPDSRFSYEQLDRMVQCVEVWKKVVATVPEEESVGYQRLASEWKHVKSRLQQLAQEHVQPQVRSLCEWMIR